MPICECVHECVCVCAVLRPKIRGKSQICTSNVIPASNPHQPLCDRIQVTVYATGSQSGGGDPPKGSQHDSKGSQDDYQEPKND